MASRNGEPRLLSRLAWFVVLWLAGVVTVGALAMVIRFALRH